MISVIVTVYNKEKYIKHCIESIENNTYKDIELIIVEDCSTDNSMNIIQELIPKYNNITLIRNEVNSGAGYSRNVGIKASKGEWLSLIDADEWIDEEYFQTYINRVEDDVDIIYGSFKYYSNNKEIDNVKRTNCIFTDMYHCIMNLHMMKLHYFNMSLIRNYLFNDIEYCKERYVEEVTTIYLLLFKSKKIQMIDYCGYNINVDPNSLTQTHSNVYTTLCMYNNIIPSIKYIIKNDNILGNKLYNFYYKKANSLGYNFYMDYNEFLEIAPFFDNICDYYKIEKEKLKEQKDYVFTHSANKDKLIKQSKYK